MKAPSIRRRLTALVLATAVPSALLAAALIAYEHQRDRERLERESIATARGIALDLDRELVGVELAARVLATSRRIHTGDFEGFRRRAEEIIESGIGTNVVLSDASGRQLLNTLVERGPPLPGHGNPAQLRAVFAGGGPVISDLYIGGVTRRPVMSVDVPVMQDGRVIYALSVGEAPERFRRLLARQGLPDDWIGALLDRKGRIVARTHEHERFLAKPGAPGLLKSMRAAPEGVVETESLEGIALVSVYSRAPMTGWTVAIGIPRASLDARLWRRSLEAAAVAALVLGLALALAWTVGGGIARSIHGLTGPAARIGLREEIEVPPLGLAEADEVGDALERASRMLVSAEHRAQHDVLTGLANRSLLMSMTDEHLALCRRENTKLALLFVDLDGFKRVNDENGHEAGDRLLCAVAERLTRAVRGSDVVARLGGDEFAVLLVRAGRETAAEVAAKLVDSLSAPYTLERGMAPPLILEISASIGVAGFPESGASADELLKRADEAMYKVKFAGKRGHALA